MKFIQKIDWVCYLLIWMAGIICVGYALGLIMWRALKGVMG